MQISLNVKNESVSKKILRFLSAFNKEDLDIKTKEDRNSIELNDFSEFSGIWKDRDIDLTTIRESAWKK